MFSTAFSNWCIWVHKSILATTRDVCIIPSFRIYVLHVEHISCVITNCGHHKWVIPSSLSIALWALLEENTPRKLLSLSKTCSSKFCYSRLLSLYSFLLLSFLLTFFRLVLKKAVKLNHSLTHLSTFHVSSRIVANSSEPSLLFFRCPQKGR